MIIIGREAGSAWQHEAKPLSPPMTLFRPRFARYGQQEEIKLIFLLTNR
jgi:hypothetical protein